MKGGVLILGDGSSVVSVAVVVNVISSVDIIVADGEVVRSEVSDVIVLACAVVGGTVVVAIEIAVVVVDVSVVVEVVVDVVVVVTICSHKSP